MNIADTLIEESVELVFLSVGNLDAKAVQTSISLGKALGPEGIGEKVGLQRLRGVQL